MKSIIFRKSLFAVGAFESDPPKDQTPEFLNLLGINADTLAKLKAGEVEDINELHKSTTTQIETALEQRIRKQVETDERTQIAKGIFSRVEQKQIDLLKAFGFDEAKALEGVEANKRFDTLVEKGKQFLADHVNELSEKIKAKSPDSAKVAQLEEQLSKANSLSLELQEKVKSMPDAIKAAKIEVQDQNEIQKALYDTLNSYGKDDTPALRMSHGNVIALTNAELAERGLKLTVKRDENGKVTAIVPTKDDGSGIAIGNTSKNHDLNSFLNEVGTKREFFKVSKGDPNNVNPIAAFDGKNIEELKKNAHPAALAELEKDAKGE